MGTVSGFLSIAGAALTTIGAVTGKKDLMKIGGFMSLGGGIGQAFNAYSAASAAGESASAMQGAQEAFRGSELAGTAATNAAMEGAAPLGRSIMESAASVSPDMARQAVGDFGADVMTTGADAMRPGVDSLSQGAAQNGVEKLFEPSIYGKSVGQPQGFDQGLTQGLPSGADPAGLSGLERGGSTMNQSELMGLLKSGAGKMGSALKGTSDFIKNNKELVSLAQGAIGGMYGPEAEAMDLRKSIYNRQTENENRRRSNLNSPVKLSYGGR